MTASAAGPTDYPFRGHRTMAEIWDSLPDGPMSPPPASDDGPNGWNKRCPVCGRTVAGFFDHVDLSCETLTDEEVDKAMVQP